jgi:hypothetical protein
MTSVGNGFTRFLLLFALSAAQLAMANAQDATSGAKPAASSAPLPGATFDMNCHCVGLLCSCSKSVAPGKLVTEVLPGDAGGGATTKPQISFSLTPEQYGSLADALAR